MTREGEIIRKYHLAIGDPDYAMKVTSEQQSQEPLKVIEQLVSNALDYPAHARTVSVILESHRGKLMIRVADDGDGFKPNPDGSPAFKEVLTMVFKSIKRGLPERERGDTVGEHGMALLGAIGLTQRGVEIVGLPKARKGVKKTKTGRVHIETSYDVHEAIAEAERKYPGTDVVLHSVKQESIRVLKPEKIHRFLCKELSERLRRRKDTTVTVIDKTSRPRKQLKVAPIEYSGTPIAELPKEIFVAGGKSIRMALYLRSPGTAEILRVAMYKQGTLIVEHIGTLPEFEKFPWNSNRLEGFIEYDSLRIPPHSRRGIMRDQGFTLFQKTIEEEVEPRVSVVVREAEKEETLKRDKEAARQIRKAFEEILKDREFPINDYYWFEAGEEVEKGVKKRRPRRPVITPLLSQSQLSRIKVYPSVGKIGVNESLDLYVQGFDAAGNRVDPASLDVEWSHTGVGILAYPARRGVTNQFLSDRLGTAEIMVRVTQGSLSFEEVRRIEVVSEPQKPPRGTRPLPPPQPETGDGTRRSRYDERLGVLKYSTSHKDYKRVVHSPSLRLRYIASLYAKELVLKSFREELRSRRDFEQEAALERFVEILTHIGAHLS
jgi:hypothetical protein